MATTVLVTSLVGCSNKEATKTSVGSNNKRAKITVYLPEGSYIDNKYKEDPDVAINYLSKDAKVNKIASNIDKSVKVLILSSDQEGLLPVFNKVKKKLPGVITIASELEEMKDKNIYKLLKDEDLSVGFSVEEDRNAKIATIMAKKMGAKKFIYLYTKGENPEYLMDKKDAKDFCEVNGMEFAALETDGQNLVLNSNPKDTAIYPASENLTEPVLNLALEKGYIIPSLNSNKDGFYLAKALGLQKEYKEETIKEFDKKVGVKLDEMGMKDRIAGISEGREAVPTELSIAIAEYMYEKNFMIEECYRDVSAIDRGIQKLDLTIEPRRISTSNGYVRNLVLSPRIY